MAGAAALIVLRENDSDSLFRRPGGDADIAINAPCHTAENAAAGHWLGFQNWISDFHIDFQVTIGHKFMFAEIVMIGFHGIS